MVSYDATMKESLKAEHFPSACDLRRRWANVRTHVQFEGTLWAVCVHGEKSWTNQRLSRTLSCGMHTLSLDM